MRLICIVMLLLLPAICYSQLDSNTHSYQTPGVKLRYYSPAAKDTLEVNNVYRLVLQDDYILTQSGKFKIDQLSSVKIRTGKGDFWSGFALGTAGGAVVGLIIGSMLDHNDKEKGGGGHPEFYIGNALISIPVGMVLGAITGGLIFTQINTYTDYDFPGSNAEFKKIELKSLMEKWRKR